MVSRTQVAKRLKKRGEVWYVIVNSDTNGQTIKSTRCTDKEEAIDIVQSSGLIEMELARKAGVLSREVIKHITDDWKVTVGDAVVKYLAHLHNTKSPKHAMNCRDVLMEWINGRLGIREIHPSELTEQNVSSFINRSGRAKMSTRMLKRALISGFIEYCRDNGWCSKNVAKLVRPDWRLLSHKQRETKKVEPYTEDEVKLILHKIDERIASECSLERIKTLMFWSLLIEIAFITGLRYGDVVCLEWDSFDSTIAIHTNKTNKLVTPIQQERLKQIIATIPRDGQYLFPEQRIEYSNPDNRHNFSSRFSALCARLGVPYRGLHALRHGYATTRAQQVPIQMVANELGHSHTKTTEGYIHET